MSSEDELEHPIYQNSKSCGGSSNGFNPLSAIMTLIDANGTLQPDEKEEIKEWVKERRELRIVVTGKTGTGKSSLLNSFIGNKFFEEGYDLDTCTEEVTQHEFEKDGLKVIVWDSPGLQDGSENEEKYLQSLVDKTGKEVDLLVYCIDMSQSRAVDLRVHGSAIKKITEILGSGIWSHTVIALTFANMFVARLKTTQPRIKEKELDAEFEARVQLWRSKIEGVLLELGIPDDITKALRVFPAGYHTVLHLPGYPYWSSQMWTTMLYAVKERAQPVPIVMNASRFREKSSLDDDSFRVPPEQQPIIITRPCVQPNPNDASSNDDVQPNPNDASSNDNALDRKMNSADEGATIGARIGVATGAVAGTAAGTAAGVTAGVTAGVAIGVAAGTTAGAVAGGIAIGAATLGVGTTIGVALGGALGLGIGTATGLLIEAYRRHKQKKQ